MCIIFLILTSLFLSTLLQLTNYLKVRNFCGNLITRITVREIFFCENLISRIRKISSSENFLPQGNIHSYIIIKTDLLSSTTTSSTATFASATFASAISTVYNYTFPKIIHI